MVLGFLLFVVVGSGLLLWRTVLIFTIAILQIIRGQGH